MAFGFHSIGYHSSSHEFLILALMSLIYVAVSLLLGYMRHSSRRSAYDNYVDFIDSGDNIPRLSLAILMATCTDPYLQIHPWVHTAVHPLGILLSLVASHVFGALFAFTYFCTKKRLHVITLHEYLDYRFHISGKFRCVLSVAHLLVYCVVTADSMIAGCELIEVLTGTNGKTAAASIILISVLCFSIGGVKSIAWNAVIQEFFQIVFYFVVMAMSLHTLANNKYMRLDQVDLLGSFLQEFTRPAFRFPSTVVTGEAFRGLFLIILFQTSFQASYQVYSCSHTEKRAVIVLMVGVAFSVVHATLHCVTATLLTCVHRFVSDRHLLCRLLGLEYPMTAMIISVVDDRHPGVQKQRNVLGRVGLAFGIVSRLQRFVSVQLLASAVHVFNDIIPILKSKFRLDTVAFNVFTGQQIVFLMGFCISFTYAIGGVCFSFLPEIKNYCLYAYIPIFFGVCTAGLFFQKPNCFCVVLGGTLAGLLASPFFLSSMVRLRQVNAGPNYNRDCAASSDEAVRTWSDRVAPVVYEITLLFPLLFSITTIAASVLLAFVCDTRGVINRLLLSPLAYENLKKHWSTHKKKGVMQRYIKSHQKNRRTVTKLELLRTADTTQRISFDRSDGMRNGDDEDTTTRSDDFL